uniref:Outer membrane autotransporter barrel domain-containing protein n=1 Tax=Candidatus Kentrum sp. TC TaxID=2126339 RepID=A0A450ZXY7_9GAMM|nr:MAG: outer membrane autotransporter barrel domain-containing protein [Candidatus Kentron sp. TC]
MLHSIADTISSRMDFTRFRKFRTSDSDPTGFSSGDGAGMASNSWIRTFGNWINQDTENGIAGYNADLYGFTAGMDTEVNENIRLGAAFGYSNADVDGKGTNNAKADVDHYQISVYGDYTDKRFYVEGMLGYAHNNNDTSDLDTANVARRAKYDSDQYMASIGMGIPIYMGDEIPPREA